MAAEAKWQVAYNDDVSDERKFLMGEPDFANSLGNLSVNAAVRMEASREGDRIVVNGVVEHSFSGEYDFRGVWFASKWARGLEVARRARTFNVGAGQEQRFSAIIVFERGRYAIEEFHWMDTDRPADWRHNEVERKKRGQAPAAAPRREVWRNPPVGPPTFSSAPCA